MDLRGLANGVTSIINPNETVTVLRSTGYTIGSGAKQVPSFAAPVTGPAQVQALDADDIKQLDGLNIQGTIRAIYLRGPLAGVVRPNQTGGDIVKRKNETELWLVVKVLESWPDWTKAVIVLQGQ
jgi:hypothetical protein